LAGRLSVKNLAQNFIKIREIIWPSVQCNTETERESMEDGRTDVFSTQGLF